MGSISGVEIDVIKLGSWQQLSLAHAARNKQQLAKHELVAQ